MIYNISNWSNTRILALTLAMLIPLVFLTGCVNQTVIVSVGDDNSATFNIKIVMDKDDFEQIGMMGIKEPDNAGLYAKEILSINPFFRKVANKYFLEDMEITPIDDSFEIGFIAYKTFSSIEGLNSFIQYLHDEGLSPIEGAVKVKDLKVIKSYKFDGALKYIIDDEILDDINSFSESDVELPGFNKEDIVDDLLSGNASFEISFPADVKSAYGYDKDDIGSNPVFKNEASSDSELIGVTAQHINKQGAAILLTFGVLLLIVLIKNVFTKLMFKRRRR